MAKLINALSSDLEKAGVQIPPQLRGGFFVRIFPSKFVLFSTRPLVQALLSNCGR